MLLISHDIHFVGEVRDFAKERAELERDYGRRLESLAKKFELRRDKLAAKRSATLVAAGFAQSGSPSASAGLVASGSVDAHPGSLLAANTSSTTLSMTRDSAVSVIESSSVQFAWSAILHETMQTSRQHACVAETLAGDVSDALKSLAIKRDESRKKHLAHVNRLLLERERNTTETEKARQKYEECCDLVDNAQQKHERATDEKAKDRYKRAWHQDILDMNNAKNLYLLAIQSANSVKAKQYRVDVPEVLDDMCELGRTVFDGIKSVWKQLVQLREAFVAETAAEVEVLRGAVNAVDPTQDSKLYSLCRGRVHIEPEYAVYVPCSLWKDLPEIAKDEYSIVFLRNLLAKYRTQLSEIEQDITIKEKGVLGLQTLLKAYTVNPLQGDADDVRENLLDSKRELAMLASLKHKLDTQIQSIVSAVGGMSAPASF
eukprot:jgi/Hompol1/6480/HPOL_002678-RA